MPTITRTVSATVMLAAIAACNPPSSPTAEDATERAVKESADATTAAQSPNASPTAAAAKAPPDRSGTSLTAEERALFTTLLRCGDTLVEFSIVDAGTADMRIANTAYAMRAVEAASGARYENSGNPETVFWNKGNQAMVFIDGEKLPDCTVVPDDATGSAPAYKARGNEPGWQLAIADGAVKLVADYGETTITAPIRNEQRAGNARTVIADAGAGTVKVNVSPGGCRDSMSGDRYADTVTVTLGERTLTGCGGAHWLRDITWRLLSMNGDPVIGGEPLTVVFGDEGRVSGYAGCNRFTGSYSLEGERLAIDPAMAATKRGCMSEELMRQENRFLTALPGMTEAATNANGELVLGDSAGARLVFRHRDSEGNGG